MLGLAASLSMLERVLAQPSEETPGPLDKRRANGLGVVALTPERQRAATALEGRISDVRIDYDAITGAPRWISSPDAFLSGPDVEDELVPRTSETASESSACNDPYRMVKAFLLQNTPLFEHGPSVLTNATMTREFTTPHNGMKTIAWQQQVDGIPVFGAYLVAHITRSGELVNLSSQFLPDSEAAARMDRVSRLALEKSPPVRPAQAVANATANIGGTLAAGDVVPVDVSPQELNGWQRFSAHALSGNARARLSWVPMRRDLISLCWEVQSTRRGHDETFRVLIDAQRGEAIVRNCLTDHVSPATYLVFPSDSPSPFSPGNQVPSSYQPPESANNRVPHTLSALSPVASPNGWINDGITETLGNNIDAHLDRDDNDQPDLPRPNGGPSRVFQPPLDLTVRNPPMGYGDAAVVNAFYWVNWFHDRLYDLGFTEAAGNFQQDNFGRGGQGNDRIQVDVQDGCDPPYYFFNGAGFTYQTDGTSGRLRLRIFDGPTPDRDAAFDAEVIFHELSHGHCQRSVGAGEPFGSDKYQSRGLKEGWGDFYALSLLSDLSDDVHAKYAIGGYVTKERSPGFLQNYYFGLRRYPYTTDMGEHDPVNYNPLTFRDIDPNRADRPSCDPDHPPRNPRCCETCQWKNTADEPHNMGEVWGVTLWGLRANLIERYGFEEGNELTLRLVTDGMVLLPPDPNFIQARDAILQADLVNTGGANHGEIWAAFARRGMGDGAWAPDSTTTIGVVESFNMPPAGGQLWSYTTGGAIYSSPAIGPDGTIYVGSTDGYLHAIHLDGQLRWAFTEPAPYGSFNSSPMVGPDGTIYARRRDGYLYAVNPNGTRKWKTLVNCDSWVSPALGTDGTIYVAGYTDLKAIRSADGAILWTFPTGNTIYSSPAIAPDGTIYFGGMDTKVYAVNPNTHQAKPGWPVVTGGAVVSSPAIDRDGTIYVGSSDGKLYALKPDGTYKWSPLTLSLGSGVDSSPALGPDGTIYVGCWDHKVYAVNPATGQVKSGWPYTTGYAVRSSPAVAADGTIFIGSDDGKVYALNPDGTAVGAPWPLQTSGQVFSSPVIGTNGTVYVGSGNDKLYALASLRGAARSVWPVFRRDPWHTGSPAALTLSSGTMLVDQDFQFQVNGLSGLEVEIDASHNLSSWSKLGELALSGGPATFTDAAASGYSYRFYRARSGSFCSGGIGYTRVTVPGNGVQALIANQLDAPPNTLSSLMPVMPDGCQVVKWTGSQWVSYIWDVLEGGWLPNGNATLAPGEGAFLCNNTTEPLTVNFIGAVKEGHLVNPIPAGYSVRSSMVPQNGWVASDLGYPPGFGDQVRLWLGGMWQAHTFQSPSGSWSPAEPVVGAGEAFFLYRTGSSPTEWVRDFVVCP